MNAKVLLVTFSDNADHQDTLFGLFEQLRDLQRRGEGTIDPYLLTTDAPRVPLVDDEHVIQVRCPARPGICRGTFDVGELLRIISLIRRERFDALYFESLHVWNVPCMLLKRRDTSVIHVIHEVVPHEGDRSEGLVDLMNRLICRRADMVVLRSDRFVPLLRERYGVSPERSCALELWRRFPPYTPPATGAPHALFFGRLNPYKGLGNLVRIARLCPEVSFEVVGRSDGQVDDLLEELGSLSNVSIRTGYVSDDEMRDAFARARWVVVPYQTASQSGVVIDAYKYSRPVIAFGVGAIAEQVSDGESGYVVPPGDVEAFSACLRRAMGMGREEYAAMTRSAYRFGAQRYSVSGAIPRFERLVSETMGIAPRRRRVAGSSAIADGTAR